MSKPTDNCVLLFVKHPVRGKVKTRLAAELGEETALELYKNFVLDMLSNIQQLNIQ